MKYKDTKEIPIDSILIEDRFRHDLGDIDTLAISIDTFTMLEPIIVQDIGNGKYRLLNGERRITALKKLKRTRVEARMYEQLTLVEQKKIELELCVRRKQLTPVEEARAIRRIWEEEKKNYEHKLPGRFGRGFTQEDLAVMLDRSQPQISRALKIAEAADSNPSLELCTTNRECLKKIEEEGTIPIRNSMISRQLEESFIVDDAHAYIESLSRNYADLIIMDIDKVKAGMFDTLFNKIRHGGALIVFHPNIIVSTVNSLALKAGFFAEANTYICHNAKEDTYLTFSWFGKSREHPLRYIPIHTTHTRENDVLHTKAKATTLMQLLIKHNTEAGGSVVIAPCFDVESIKVCIEQKRNVIGVCPNRILRDKALIRSEG